MKHILSKEDIEALMGLAPFNRGILHWFTPVAFLRKTKEGEFIIKKELHPSLAIKAMTIEQAKNAPKTQGSLASFTQEDLSEIARKVVFGWKNIIDIATGEEIAFKADSNGNPEQELWDRLPPKIKGEFLLEALRIGGLAVGEKLGLD